MTTKLLAFSVLNIPSDIAGATFMAIATSSPEFFTNVVGTFVTEGNIGVGSVVGSVVFNLLAIISWCGFAVKDVSYTCLTFRGRSNTFLE